MLCMLNTVRNLLLPTTFLFSLWLRFEILQQTLFLFDINCSSKAVTNGKKNVSKCSLKLLSHKNCTIIYFKLFGYHLYLCFSHHKQNHKSRLQKRIFACCSFSRAKTDVKPCKIFKDHLNEHNPLKRNLYVFVILSWRSLLNKLCVFMLVLMIEAVCTFRWYYVKCIKIKSIFTFSMQ